MSDTLMPFQITGAEWLAGRRRAMLADEMGTGKTCQLIRAADLVGARRIFTNCPAIGRVNWRREFDKWGLVCPEFMVESYDRIAVNEKARRAVREFRPDVAILDEAHYLKSREAKRTRALYGQHCHGNGLLRDVPFVWLATGTPFLNDVTELWTHLRAHWPDLITVNGEVLGLMQFMDRYTNFALTDYGDFKVFANKPEMVPELRAILRKIMLRRKAADVLPEMPPIFWHDYPIEADRVEAELVALEGHPEMDALRRVVEAAMDDEAPWLALDEEQVALATWRRLTGVTKARPVAALIADELASGQYDKIVLFAWHKEVIDILGAELAPFAPVCIRGGQTDRARQEQIDAFQQQAKNRVALVQIAAGYHTITLHAAAQVGFVEKAWTPDINVQAAKRAHRYGQSRPVRVRSFGLVNSMDDGLNKVLVRKARAILELMED